MRIWKQCKNQVPAPPIIVSMSPPSYPSAWLRPRSARSRFARQDHCSSTTCCGLNFRMRRDGGGIHFERLFRNLATRASPTVRLMGGGVHAPRWALRSQGCSPTPLGTTTGRPPGAMFRHLSLGSPAKEPSPGPSTSTSTTRAINPSTKGTAQIRRQPVAPTVRPVSNSEATRLFREPGIRSQGWLSWTTASPGAATARDACPPSGTGPRSPPMAGSSRRPRRRSGARPPRAPRSRSCPPHRW